MTLDEAIKHCEEVMMENLEKTKDRNASDPIAINCFECADKHRQLAEWLKELQAHREAWKGLQHDVYELHKILFNMKPQHRTTTVAGDILGLIEAYKPKEGDTE